MHLDHTIVPSHDKVASAKFFAHIMGLQFGGLHGPFAVVNVDDQLSMDFDDRRPVTHHHYAFRVSDTEFDEVFSRVKKEGLQYGSGPGVDRHNMQINHRNGGRGVYFDDPSGHSIEILTC